MRNHHIITGNVAEGAVIRHRRGREHDLLGTRVHTFRSTVRIACVLGGVHYTKDGETRPKGCWLEWVARHKTLDQVFESYGALLPGTAPQMGKAGKAGKAVQRLPAS